ncbi:PAAR domain-containing protein [Burkholderia glumae]
MARTYYAAVDDDPLTSGPGSRVIALTPCGTIEGDDGKHRRLAFIGDTAYCPECNSTGAITYGADVDATLRMADWVNCGRRQAVGGDIVLCKCATPPRIIARFGLSWEIIDNGGEGSPPVANEPARSVAYAEQSARTDLQRDVNANTHAAPDATPSPASRAEVDAGECAYLDGSKPRIDAPARFYDTRHNVTLSKGKPTIASFPGLGDTPATEYDALVDGRNIPVYVSNQAPPKGTAVFNEKQIAHALGTLPDEHLEHLHKVTIDPVANPDDAVWKAQYNDPSFYSGATASIKKGVTAYPWKEWFTVPQQYVDSTITHETGHQISEALWADPLQKKAWEDAIASDGQAPSEYARNNSTEDFAETANMYRSSKGTPCEAEGRKRYPARYRYFDSITK